MTTSVVSTFQMKRKQNKSVGDSLIPLFLMKILQNRRYQQVAEIRDVIVSCVLGANPIHRKQWHDKRRWISVLYPLFAIFIFSPTKMSRENCWLFSTGLYKSFHKSSNRWSSPEDRFPRPAGRSYSVPAFQFIAGFSSMHKLLLSRGSQRLSPGSSWHSSHHDCHPRGGDSYTLAMSFMAHIFPSDMPGNKKLLIFQYSSDWIVANS